MGNYKLRFIGLNGCPYSIAAEKLIKDNKNVEITWIQQKDKHIYKNEQIQTFPQIYLKKNDQEILLGGYEDLKNAIDKLKNNFNIEEFQKTYINFNKKKTLRLAQLINQI